MSKENPGEAPQAMHARGVRLVAWQRSVRGVVMRLHARRTGVGLVQRIFNYVHKHGSSRTVVMASGVRTSAGDSRLPPLQLSSGRCWQHIDRHPAWPAWCTSPMLLGSCTLGWH